MNRSKKIKTGVRIMTKKLVNNKIYLIIFILLIIIFMFPSIIHVIQTGKMTDVKFEMTWFYSYPQNQTEAWVNGICYVIIFSLIAFGYFKLVKHQKEIFKNVRQILLVILLVCVLVMFMIPFTSTDVYYYMAVRKSSKCLP